MRLLALAGTRGEGLMKREGGLPLVLVIDDAADHRLHLVSILRKNGYPCASTSPAPGALEFAARMKPDLVLARRPENASASSRLLVDVRRVLPDARVVLFVSSQDAVPTS